MFHSDSESRLRISSDIIALFMKGVFLDARTNFAFALAVAGLSFIAASVFVTSQ